MSSYESKQLTCSNSDVYFKNPFNFHNVVFLHQGDAVVKLTAEELLCHIAVPSECV